MNNRLHIIRRSCAPSLTCLVCQRLSRTSHIYGASHVDGLGALELGEVHWTGGLGRDSCLLRPSLYHVDVRQMFPGSSSSRTEMQGIVAQAVLGAADRGEVSEIIVRSVRSNSLGYALYPAVEQAMVLDTPMMKSCNYCRPYSGPGRSRCRSSSRQMVRSTSGTVEG